MRKILDALVRGVLSYVALWLKAQRAQRLETKVKKLQSQKRAADIERRMAEKLDEDLDMPPKPSAWNAGRGASIILLVFVLAGCCDYVEGAWPIIPDVQRPVLSEDPPEWTPREKKLVQYAVRLETAITTYNKQARAHNRTYGH